MPTQELLDHLYRIGSRSVIGEWGPGVLTIPEKVCLNLESSRTPARYLELGVGQGHLYQEFIQRGWQCTGVGDWSSQFPNVLRNLSLVPPTLAADVIAAFDVLEHVADPIAILRSLRQFASPSAHLYCAMPNRESDRARRDREQWRMLRPIGHVNYFSRKSIALALRHAGFKLRRLRATDLWEFRFPRNRSEIKPALTELLGRGDQWIAIADAS